MRETLKILDAAAARDIDRLCDRFEKEWEAGENPRLETYVADWTGNERSRLLSELLWLEWDLRRNSGEVIVYSTYFERFPDDRALIDEVIRREATQAASSDTGASSTDPKQQATGWQENQGLSLGGTLKVDSLHAMGGLGEVYLANDTNLKRMVAVKRIRAGFATHSINRRRFVLEAEVTGRLEHPGIVPIHGMGTDEAGHPFYVMKFIRGVTLEQKIVEHHQTSKRGREHDLEFRRLLTHFVAACRAVDFAHSQGIIHRDIKPTNIMLGEYGETQVVDWGLAKVLNEEHEEERLEITENPGPSPLETTVLPTQIGVAIGTPAYMSPEQAEGAVDRICPASDVYGLGATLYFLLTKQPPIKDRSLDRVLARVKRGEFPRPRYLLRTVPKSLDAVCAKAMQTKPEHRYASAASLADDIEAFLGNESVSAWREPLSVRFQRYLRRHQNLLLGAMLLLALLATALVTRAYRSEKAAKVMATRHADSAGRISEIFEGLYGGLVTKDKPTFLLGIDHRETDILHAAHQVESDLSVDDFVRARLMDTIGEHFTMMGDLQNGERFLVPALTIRRQFPDRAIDLAASVHHVAFLRFSQGRSEEAHQLASEAVTLRAQRLGPNAEKTIASKILLLLTTAELRDAGDDRYIAASSRRLIHAWQDILELKKLNSPDADPDTAGIYAAIAYCQAYVGQPLAAAHSLGSARKAYAEYQASETFLKTGMEVHPGELFSKVVTAFAVGKFPLLAPIFGNPESIQSETMQMSKFAFHRNEGHPGNLWVRLKMTSMIDDFPTMEVELRDSLRLARETFNGQPRLADFTQKLSEVLLNRAKLLDDEVQRSAALQEAKQLADEALEILLNLYGEEHWRTAEAYKILARTERDAGNLEEAEALFRKALVLHQQAGVRGIRWFDVQLDRELAGVLESVGRDAEAKQIRANSAEKFREYEAMIPDRLAQAYAASPELGSIND